MVRTRPRRRLATVLFVDIVDSTRVASEVGDGVWRELLGSFRRAVRHRLKSEHGQEQDTAGDGFFATFDEPAAAIRAAVGILGDVQSLGLDARCGIHTGELERIDGRLGGIAAHIGARVMAEAGPAEVLVTATVHDLVIGSRATFDEERVAQLKGVPGPWTLYRVASVDGVATVAPLAAEDATRRRSGAAPQPRRRSLVGGRRAILIVVVTGSVVVAALGSGVLQPRENPSLAGAPSPTPAPERPPSMVKIDAATNAVVLEVVDRHLPVWNFPSVYVVDGVLWQDVYIAMVRRDIVTGDVLSTLEERLGAGYGAFPAFGSLWLDEGAGPDGEGDVFRRIDPISGRELAAVTVEGPVRSVAVARDGIHLLTDDEVTFIDPDANAVTDRDPHGLETVPDRIEYVGGRLWICECDEGRIIEWDPESDTGVRTIEFAQRGFFLYDQRDLSQASVSIESSIIWLADGDSGTLTPVDTVTGEAGQPLGIPRQASSHAFGVGSIWFSAVHNVVRIDLETREETSIPLPEGFRAGGLAVDEATGAVWVSNFVERGEPIPPPMPSQRSPEP